VKYGKIWGEWTLEEVRGPCMSLWENIRSGGNYFLDLFVSR
jgi:hypothetical protein